MKLAQRLAHFFYPRTSNNHKAKVLQPGSILLIALSIVTYQLVLSFVPRFTPQVLGYAANISPEEVIRLTNEKRQEQGLSPLRHDPVLSQAALAKGNHMLEHDYWAHVAPDGTEPWKFFIDFDYTYRYAGENLARDFSSADAAINAWMASPTHRANMLSENYSDIGIAVVEGDLGGVDTTLIVQFFGTRLGAQVPAAAGVQDEVESLPVKPSLTETIEAAAPLEYKAPVVSPLELTREFTLGIVGALTAVLLIDVVVMKRRKLARIGGRAFAHISFFGMLIAILVIVRAGQIL